MEIRHPGSTPSARGSSDWFTGIVRIDCPFNGSGALACATVTFEPGAVRRGIVTPWGRPF
ncbi:hypothetical protein [Asaia prunellae]|uniref:hypothetical protein n=1 Tax=Asaia prunellae TaxID=610245 RepID=UPI001FB0A581